MGKGTSGRRHVGTTEEDREKKTWAAEGHITIAGRGLIWCCIRTRWPVGRVFARRTTNPALSRVKHLKTSYLVANFFLVFSLWCTRPRGPPSSFSSCRRPGVAWGGSSGELRLRLYTPDDSRQSRSSRRHFPVTFCRFCFRAAAFCFLLARRDRERRYEGDDRDDTRTGGDEATEHVPEKSESR